ncbi:aldehyde dehydrogenase family protein [Fluviibacterium sp. DFM31]|uniref:Aldehyde dehydrogenase family protein n=1 Tax=Meridianimarinicoccus marinus TaxID=3231483 RepID=A0ABV3L851_9RHOB
MTGAAPDFRQFIGGDWSVPKGKPAIAQCDPATGQARAPMPVSTPDDVARAVAAAAASGWEDAPKPARLDLMRRLLEAVARREAEFTALISREIGAPVDFARKQQVGAALGHLQATLAAAEAASEDQPVAPDSPEHRVRHEPLGPAALITPWNWPLNQVVLKVGAALLAGCPMVLKPSELSSRTAVLFAECMAEAGTPPGVFNLVLGGADTGAALVTARAIRVVSFTGSTGAGQAIAAAAAPGFKRTILELGGKSPNLLFADCDLPVAIRQGIAHCMRNAGQSCNAASRMLVERSVYDRAVVLATEAARDTEVGHPDAAGAHIGPLVSAAQWQRVQSYIALGRSEGARCIAGGEGRPAGLDAGFYARPTVFADVTPQMRIFQEEIFGPVLTMTPFKDEAEAIALANNSDFGLAGYIQTGTPARADRVARALQVGMVQVNGQSRAAGAPFGGRKSSGLGREAGLWGIRGFQAVKSISGAAFHAG